MVWACGKNIRVSYGQIGAIGGRWRAGTRETEVRLDGCVKVALGNRGMTVEAARQCAKEWRALVHM